MLNPVSYTFRFISTQLAALGVIDEKRGRRLADLTWPRFLTMFIRNLYRVADIAMVGLAVGPAAIAGLAFASIYWGLANAFSLGLAGGTISQVSQRFGAERFRRLDLAVKQSLWIGVAITLPFLLTYWFFAESLIGLVGSDAATIAHGTAYLQILSLGLVFNVLNQASSRTLAGADDTWIAMSVRATGAATNIVLNAFFIFELGMGVDGAALGTVLAEGLVTCCFAWGFIRGTLPIIGQFPVTLSPYPPYFDLALTKQLLVISPPLIGQHLLRTVARFPLFAILALLGPTVVAAFEVGRRIRRLMSTPGSGFSMAASGTVGQELGRGDEAGADRYALDVISFSAVVYAISAGLVFVLARPIAQVFAEDPTVIAQTVPFVQIAAVSFLALGISKTFSGILKAAGDNRWILYSRLCSQYFVLIPITYLGVITPLGVRAVFIGLIAEGITMSVITGYRYLSGQWKVISRARRPDTAD